MIEIKKKEMLNHLDEIQKKCCSDCKECKKTIDCVEKMKKNIKKNGIIRRLTIR